jgi:hypothetical protein
MGGPFLMKQDAKHALGLSKYDFLGYLLSCCLRNSFGDIFVQRLN